MEIIYQIEDGYINNGDHSVEVPDDEILECDNEAEVTDLIYAYIVEDFQQNIYPVAENEDEALAFWKSEKGEDEEEDV